MQKNNNNNNNNNNKIKIHQKFERERERERNRFVLREKYAQNERDNDKFIVSGCE